MNVLQRTLSQGPDQVKVEQILGVSRLLKFLKIEFYRQPKLKDTRKKRNTVRSTGNVGKCWRK